MVTTGNSERQNWEHPSGNEKTGKTKTGNS